MWLMTFMWGCGSLPEKPYRIDEATGAFASWRSNSCVCSWDLVELEAQVGCGDVGLGEVTLYLPFSGRDANRRLASSVVAQIDMGGVTTTSGFTGGPLIWEYSSSYSDPRQAGGGAADNTFRRDVLIHELVLPAQEACSALPPETCVDIEESRLKMALSCADRQRSLDALRLSAPPEAQPLAGDPVQLRGAP